MHRNDSTPDDAHGTFLQNLKHALETSDDVREPVRANTASSLHKNQSILEKLISTIPYSVFWKDRNSVYLGCNPKFARDAGLSSPAEIVGKDDYDMPWTKEEAGNYRKDDLQLIASGKSRLNFEETQLNAQGQETIVMTSKVMLTDDNNEVVGILGIYTDITEFRMAQRRVTEQQAKLISASKMSSLGEMAGGIAHEINNPLAIIHALSSQLRETITEPNYDPAEVTRILGRIEATVDRAAKIVVGLRSFSRDSSNDPFRECSWQSIIDSTLPFCAERFRNRSIELLVDAVPAELKLQCRSTQLSQVLLNALNNAFDAIEGSEKPWVKLTTLDAGDNIEMLITNSGPPISEANQVRLFQPFYTTKEIGRGTGLGLSVSRGLVEAHGGTFTYCAGLEHTQFKISVPKTQAQASPRVA